MNESKYKIENQAILAALNIPYYDRVILYKDEMESKIRSSIDIAKRILVLSYLCYVAGTDENKSAIINYLKEEDLWNSASKAEKKLFLKKNPTAIEKITISWSIEAVWLLLFTINKVEKLDLPQLEINLDLIFDRLPEFMADSKAFINSAATRPVIEILSMWDLIYRLHWACRDAELNDKKQFDLNPGILQERHHAINWVINSDKNWENITTDT